MPTHLQTYTTSTWDQHFVDSVQREAIGSLEEGQLLFLPNLSFSLHPEETQFLSHRYVDRKTKHISYQPTTRQLWGTRHLTNQQYAQLKIMLDRFSQAAYTLIQRLLTPYALHLVVGRTSFRPVQVSQRKTSYRKDDTRLHVDAFPATPNQGKRILRVFCNINPHTEDRVWHIGEPFERVAERFIPTIQTPTPLTRRLLHWCKITKSYRTLYDHYMLHMHHHMKADQNYQNAVSKQEVRFPPNSTWIAQTDQVSHASMSGRYALEQTFYLPVHAMFDELRSPLRILEKMLGKKLA